uniref:Uncharacterized protein n=1 Tax=Ditylenchus dipsaci TaxID=166011 RepID=A0A915E401_9BILA
MHSPQSVIDQAAGRPRSCQRQPSYWNYFTTSDNNDGLMKRSQQPYAANTPLIRFGKRSPPAQFGGMSRQARTQQHMMDPIIRFGKRTPSTAPLIRLENRAGGNFAGSAPHIRFGKRSKEPLTSSEEIMGYWEPTAADYLYSRINRNTRLNPVDFEDTM